MCTAIRRGDRAELGAFRNLSTPHGFLDLPRPLDGVKRAGEHCENTVSGRLDHPAVVSLGARTDYIAKQGHPPSVSARLIFRHQDRIADDIHEGDRCQSPLVSRRGTRKRRRGGHFTPHEAVTVDFPVLSHGSARPFPKRPSDRRGLRRIDHRGARTQHSVGVSATFQHCFVTPLGHAAGQVATRAQPKMLTGHPRQTCGRQIIWPI